MGLELEDLLEKVTLLESQNTALGEENARLKNLDVAHRLNYRRVAQSLAALTSQLLVAAEAENG